MKSEDSRSPLIDWIGTCAAIGLGVVIGLGILGAFLLLWIIGTW